MLPAGMMWSVVMLSPTLRIQVFSIDSAEYVYDRTQRRCERSRNEIGIHSVRGGTIVGEHEVIFSGRGEVIRISHSAQGRELFAQGALAAAEYIKNKQNGFYSMKELLADSAVGMK